MKVVHSTQTFVMGFMSIPGASEIFGCLFDLDVDTSCHLIILTDPNQHLIDNQLNMLHL